MDIDEGIVKTAADLMQRYEEGVIRDKLKELGFNATETDEVFRRARLLQEQRKKGREFRLFLAIGALFVILVLGAALYAFLAA